MIKRLAIISTHPIQYYAPVFKLLAKQLSVKVFYTAGQQTLKDKGFDQVIEWDLPLLDGYDYEFLQNTAVDQGSHHFNGIVNPFAIDQIQQFKPQAILVYGWAWKSHLKIIRFFKGEIPILFRGDSHLLGHQSAFKKVIKTLFLRWVYAHVDFAFYVGTANRRYFETYGLKNNQLIFAPHAIDNERFASPQNLNASELRASLLIPPSDILILFAGKLQAVKNPDLLLQAFLALQLPNVHLLFVGNGALETTLKLNVQSLYLAGKADLNAAKRVHFKDFHNQTQMPFVYQACDLFCLPSKSESWGLAVNEAMAAGKAILVSDKVGCAEDLVTPKTGAIFKSGDLDDLKQKLIALTNNKEELIKMGEQAFKHIQNWSFEQQVNTIAQHVNR
jgi:glycosyltransferase involved in cell wall biosynthesis